MAVLAVYILLALVGTGVCHEQRDAPTSPSLPPPPPTPPPKTISIPEAAAGATEAPPTPAPFLDRRETGRSTFIQKLLSNTKRRDPALYNYDQLNAARSQGRSIVRSKREPCGDGAEVEFSPRDEKLHADAMLYQAFGAVERGRVDYPEDRREMGVDEDNDETDDEEENVFRPQNRIPLISSSSPPLSDRVNGTATTEPTAVPASNSANSSFGNWQTFTSHAQSASLEISPATFSPESQLPSASHAFREGNRQYVVSQTEENILTVLPSRLPSFASGKKPGASWFEVVDHTMENRYNNQSDHIVQSVHGIHPARQLNNTFLPEETIRLGNDQFRQLRRDVPEQRSKGDGGGDRSEGCSLQLPAAAQEPQPGPSGVCCVPSQNTNNSTPVRSENEHSRYEQDVIFLVDHDTEVFDPSGMVLQFKGDLNKELERLFGVRQDSEESSLHQPELQPCHGEVEMDVFGTKESPYYIVQMKCYREPDICPPPSVCSAMVDTFTVNEQEDVPLLKFMRHKLLPAKFPLPTGCLCVPPV